MGEQVHSLTSANTWLPIMRSSRGKLFMYIIVLGGMGFVIFLLSSVHSNMKQIENSNEKCQQQRDSLSAQLQVVYEHKNRLEKSLQQEKSDHRHSKEEHEKRLQEQDNKLQQEKEKRRTVETQLTQLKTSYAELEVDKKHAESLIKDQLQTMQIQKEQEIKKLQVHISKLLEEKDKLEQSSATLIWKVEQSANEANMCRQQQDLLQQELNKCKEEAQKSHAEVANPVPIITKRDDTNAAAAVTKVTGAGRSTTKQSTTSDAGLKSNVLQNPNAVPDEKTAAEAFQKALNVGKNDTNEIKPAVNVLDPHDAKDMNQGFDLKRNDLLSNNEIHDNNNAIYQFQPPDSQNQAAERGEDANAIQPAHQVEKPAFREHILDSPLNNVKSNIPVPLDNSAAQARFMLENSPDDTNPFNKKSPSNQFLGGDLGDDRMNKLRANAEIPKQDLPEIEDKHQYDDDDDDQDVDNEDNVGAGQGRQDRQQLNEPDFDDQESKDIPKPEDGVMISPK